MKGFSLQNRLLNLLQFFFLGLSQGVDLIKLFWSEFTYYFCKLDLFRAPREKSPSSKLI